MTDKTTPTATAPEGTVKDKRTTQFYLALFSKEVSATHTATANYLKGGLSAIAHMATLAYFASAVGASRKQVTFLLIGKDKVKQSDSGEAKVYRNAMGLAAYWQLKQAMPQSIRDAAQSGTFADGVNAVLNWLASNDVRSIEGLSAFLRGDKAPEAKPLPDRIEAAIKGAVKRNEFASVDAASIAVKAINVMSLATAHAFVEAAVAEYGRLAKLAADAAAQQAAEAMGADPEALAATGTEG